MKYILTVLLVILVLGVLPAVAASKKTHRVMLKWRAVPAEHIGYNVYRSESEDHVFKKMNTKPLKSTKYVDRTVQGSKSYEYYVTTVGKNGVESMPTIRKSFTVPSDK
jgi:fibronectin type 3 domain-containing protein